MRSRAGDLGLGALFAARARLPLPADRGARRPLVQRVGPADRVGRLLDEVVLGARPRRGDQERRRGDAHRGARRDGDLGADRDAARLRARAAAVAAPRRPRLRPDDHPGHRARDRAALGFNLVFTQKLGCSSGSGRSCWHTPSSGSPSSRSSSDAARALRPLDRRGVARPRRQRVAHVPPRDAAPDRARRDRRRADRVHALGGRVRDRLLHRGDRDHAADQDLLDGPLRGHPGDQRARHGRARCQHRCSCWRRCGCAAVRRRRERRDRDRRA